MSPPLACIFFLGISCLYFTRIPPVQVLHVGIAVMRKLGKYPEALRLALRLQNETLVTDIVNACEDP